VNSVDIGKKIREKRISYNLMVKDLASFVDVSGVYITQIEKHGKLPSIRIFKKICVFLDCGALMNDYLKIKEPELYKYARKAVKNGTKLT
jgi:transcriptional regulator with XRE-family HTH domain